MFIMVLHSLSVRLSVTVINPDFGPQLEISLRVNSLFMVKDSYQCLKDFFDFGLQ